MIGGSGGQFCHFPRQRSRKQNTAENPAVFLVLLNNRFYSGWIDHFGPLATGFGTIFWMTLLFDAVLELGSTRGWLPPLIAFAASISLSERPLPGDFQVPLNSSPMASFQPVSSCTNCRSSHLLSLEFQTSIAPFVPSIRSSRISGRFSEKVVAVNPFSKTFSTGDFCCSATDVAIAIVDLDSCIFIASKFLLFTAA